MLKMPSGEVYMNEVTRENSIAVTDNPDTNEIIEMFTMWKDANTLICVRGGVPKTYNRKDFIKE